MKHTPTPWEITDQGKDYPTVERGQCIISRRAPIVKQAYIVGELAECKTGYLKHPHIVAQTTLYTNGSREEQEANAAFIVEACNAYDSLIYWQKKRVKIIQRLIRERGALLFAAKNARDCGESDDTLDAAIALCDGEGES